MLLFLLQACAEPEATISAAQKIEINPERNVPFNLSAICDTLNYVFLNSPMPIGAITRIIHHKGMFYILDGVVPKLYCFKENGEFIFDIESIGKGPGEFIKPIDFTIDPYSDEIKICTSALHKILIYDLEGKYKKEEKIKAFLGDLMVLDAKNYIFYDYNTIQQGKGRYMFNVISKDYEPRYRSIPFERGKHSFGVSKPFSDQYDILSTFSFDNNIYALSKEDNKYDLVPRYYIDFGRYKMRDELIADYGQITSENIRRFEYETGIRLCFRLSRITETKSYLYFSFQYGQDYRAKDVSKRVFYSKKSRKYLLDHEIINDLDGVPIHRVKGLTTEEEFISVIYPYKIKEIADSGKNPYLFKFLEKYSNIGKFDNPILMIYNLKKH